MSDRPYVSFSEVKAKVSLPDVLRVLGLQDRFTEKGNTLAGVCPLPEHQHGPRPNPEQFKINCRDGVWLWHCFGDCQRGGDVVEFVKAMCGHDNAHVRFWFAEHFAERLGLSRPKTTATASPEPAQNTDGSSQQSAVEPAFPDSSDKAGQTKRQRQEPSPNSSEPCEDLKPLRFHLNLDPNVDYLRQRGLTGETVHRYGLGLCRRGLLKGYVAIPIYRWPGDEAENPVAYLGRWPGEDHDKSAGRPRYRWPEGFAKRRVVYGLHQAMATSDDLPLVIVEGPFPVYHLAQAGLPTAVAVFGSSLSDEQARLLIRTGRQIVLMFDGDQAGQNGMRQAAGKLIKEAFVRVVSLPADRQPDDLSPETLAELLAFATS